MSPIPILLLKTRSIPNDNYEDHFSTPTSAFLPSFVPVLEHQPNEQSLNGIKTLLRERRLNEEYGGMIFTSQRAVEGFARAVHELEGEGHLDDANPKPPPNPVHSTLFPLYTVGPATSRTLSTLIAHSPALLQPLQPSISGSHTGSGGALASHIRAHYNGLHRAAVFALYEAPRLPFVPLVGTRSEQYPRLEAGDRKLAKRPLCFLVGEQRRDVIPRTLMDGRLSAAERVEVVEVEVYSTVVMARFEADLRGRVEECESRGDPVVAVVVFSPSGCETMLRVLGFIDGEEKKAKRRRRGRADEDAEGATEYVIVTIGPTTKDYLKYEFDLDADVCASKPSPEGISEGLSAFLKDRGVL